MLEILLIEDNPTDAEYTVAELSGWDIEHRVEVLTDGEEGLDRLIDGPRPDLVLLDLNLPRVSGVEVLRRVRLEDRLHDLCVIVLATSDAERDVLESERLEADGYITKPIAADELQYHYYRVAANRDRS